MKKLKKLVHEKISDGLYSKDYDSQSFACKLLADVCSVEELYQSVIADKDLGKRAWEVIHLLSERNPELYLRIKTTDFLSHRPWCDLNPCLK